MDEQESQTPPFFRQEVRHFQRAWLDLGRSKQIWIAAPLVVLFVLLPLYIFLWRAPADFPEGRLVTIPEGALLSEISADLKNKSVIRSEFMFKVLVVLFPGNRGALAGDYFFEEKVSIWGISKTVSKGLYGLKPQRITIPEGITIYETAELFDKKFTEFDSVEFLGLVKEKEGYLFPDTYFFLPNVKAEQIVREMEQNFENKVAEIQEEILAFGKPLKDIIIMASLLEEEARTTETRRTIAGILWNRLDIGMPLQVDAVFPYIIGKNTFEVSLEDLKVDSPYNTYKYRGLPIGPITNPGLDSILSAVTPIKSPYIFYLSDLSGNMYYAETFAEHVVNKQRYLK